MSGKNKPTIHVQPPPETGRGRGDHGNETVKVERPPRYTGPIKECPNKTVVETPTENRTELFEQAYNTWATEFFKNKPRGRLSHNGFTGTTLTIRGTGDNGRWLVAWWIDQDE